MYQLKGLKWGKIGIVFITDKNQSVSLIIYLKEAGIGFYP